MSIIFHSKTLELPPAITWQADHLPTEPAALNKWLKKDPDFFFLLLMRRKREGVERKKLNPGPLEAQTVKDKNEGNFKGKWPSKTLPWDKD